MVMLSLLVKVDFWWDTAHFSSVPSFLLKGGCALSSNVMFHPNGRRFSLLAVDLDLCDRIVFLDLDTVVYSDHNHCPIHLRGDEVASRIHRIEHHVGEEVGGGHEVVVQSRYGVVVFGIHRHDRPGEAVLRVANEDGLA